MLLTKKGLRKIIILAICYFILGSSCVIAGIFFANLGSDDRVLFLLGAVTYILGVLFVFLGRYVEGKGRLINLGNKLVRNELKPAQFIYAYTLLRNSDDLVICKPSVELLQLLAIAYNSLDDTEACLATVEEMIAAADEKKKIYATLIKASFLFDCGKIQEAELLFTQAQNGKLDLMSTALADAILKSDRAMAMGDYKMAEMYNVKMLAQTFPKPDNLSVLIVHYNLGEIYEKTQEVEKAISHYQYCADHGGETEIKRSATQKLQSIGNSLN